MEVCTDGRTDERKEVLYEVKCTSTAAADRAARRRRLLWGRRRRSTKAASRLPLFGRAIQYNTPPENLSKLTIKFRKLDTDARRAFAEL